MRAALVAGNWKMNGSLASIAQLLAGIKQGLAAIEGVELAVFPPFVYLPEVQRQLADTTIAWGAQTIAEHLSGAYTGEVSAIMLNDFSCKYALIGHSERRTLYGETNALIAHKFHTARSTGLTPLLCVGETLQERESGATETIIGAQLDAVLALGVAEIGHAVIAYEPVWAIGTGKTASPDQAQQVHAFIRSKIAKHDVTISDSIKILYGGSVKRTNAADLFSMPDIDGGLIGGASLDAEEFLSIAQAATRY